MENNGDRDLCSLQITDLTDLNYVSMTLYGLKICKNKFWESEVRRRDFMVMNLELNYTALNFVNFIL